MSKYVLVSVLMLTACTQSAQPDKDGSGGMRSPQPNSAGSGGMHSAQPNSAGGGGTQSAQPSSGGTGGGQSGSGGTQSAQPNSGGTGGMQSTQPNSGGTGGMRGIRLQGIRESYAKGEIHDLCQTALATADTRVKELANVAATDRTDPDKTLLVFEESSADFLDVVQPLIFMGYVSPDPDLRAEASECEVNVGQFAVDVNLRREVYDAIKGAVPRNSDEARLLAETLATFKRNGLDLPDAKLAELKDLGQQLATLEAQFANNLNEDVTTVSFTKEQLAGLPDSFFTGRQADQDGLYSVSTNASEYSIVSTNAKVASTREALLRAYWSRAGEMNTQLLNQALQLRQKIAALLNYATWADYRIDGRMAVNAKNVLDLLVPLKDKLAARNKQDLDILLEAKKLEDPTATAIEAWDVSYYATLVERAKFNIDHGRVREYFPADVVMKGIFDVYSALLGLRFAEVANAKVWDPGVKQYEIRNKVDDALIGYFYTDLIPRPGKYSHAAAFPLIPGRVLKDGAYSHPIAAIVANFAEPTGDQPSLLTHDAVETLFHEFGHIMHQTLTRAPYASLSGSAVARDFVEAPSQMLENWVWSPQILNIISGHYQDHSQKLPADLLQGLVSARNFNQGYIYTRQLVLGLADMEIHTTIGAVNADQIHDRLYEQGLGIKPVSGSHFMATFGHMMSGYDAAYYGYIWSEVYAADMFTQFQNDLLDASVGSRYRTTILERGNMVPALELVEQFLGRKVTSDAFNKKLSL
jgi:thimet oligopeptidase